MAWNDGSGGGPKDPWGRKKTGSTDKDTKNNQNKENPDIDEMIRQGQENIRRLMGGGNKGSGSGGKGPGFNLSMGFLGLVLLIGLGLWAATGFYRVKEGEKAVVLLFGKVNRTADPGLRYHLPAPIERSFVVPVSKINVVQSGTAPGLQSKRAAQLRGTDVQDLMLTGDENLVKVRFTVQWFVKDISHFLFNDPRPQETVRTAAESALREVVAQTTLAGALTSDKAAIIAKSKKLLQQLLDDYQVGIEVSKVNLEEVNPPDTVIDSFRDVQRARADLESKVNAAKAYSNSIIPVARGQGRQLIENAEARKKELVEIANGEAERFTLVLNAYRQAPEVTLMRLRLQNIEETLAGMSKIIISGQGGSQGVLPYLPLDALKTRGTGASDKTTSSASSSEAGLATQSVRSVNNSQNTQILEQARQARQMSLQNPQRSR